MKADSTKRFLTGRWVVVAVSVISLAAGTFYVAAHNAALAMAWGTVGGVAGAFAFADWIHDDTV